MKKFLKIFPSKKRIPRSSTGPPETIPNPTPATSEITSHPFGCEILFEGATPITADVVFVHGLHGHRMNSWSRDGVCWPKDLLSQEESFSHIRVLTFGYDANVINPDGRMSLNNLFDHSFNLLHELSRERRHDVKDRPIVFVAHSLGGIIVKDALGQSENVRESQPHLAHIASATRGIIFLGTPHRGSGVTSLANLVASVAQVALHNTILVRDLERDSQTLDRIRDSFRRILDKHSISVWSFVEELAISGTGKKVVDGDSAIIDYSRETRGTIHADHIGMTKFSHKDDHGYKKILYAIEMVLEGPPKDEPPSAEDDGVGEKAAALYDIPQIRASHFVSRNALLIRLEKLFERSATTLSRLIVVLFGMGGVGKTQLTIEYCLRRKNSGTIQAIFWVDASSRNSLFRSIELIAKRLLPGRVFDKPDDAVTSVKETLSNWSDAWLIVVDNFDDPSELQDILQILPDSQCGSILITSRHAGSRELGESIEVDCMEKSEGLQLLRSPENEPEELAAAEEILIRLGYLPLAIDQARAYISRRQLRLKDFLGEFERRKKNIMKETPQFWQYRRTLPDNKKISLSLLTTWEMSLPLLGVDDTGNLKDVLTLFSFFHPFSISEDIFSPNAESPTLTTSPMSIFDGNVDWDHLKFEDAVLQMQELSLIRFSHRGTNEIVVSLHSMVSEWLRMRLDDNSRSTFHSIAISHLKNYLESTEPNDYATRKETLSHLDTICHAAEFNAQGGSISEACLTFGGFYDDLGRFDDAEKMYNNTLASYEGTLGLEHESTLGIFNNLASLYSKQGRLEDAERMYSRALSGKEKALGSDHMSTLDTVNNFGHLYSKQGRLDDAERMYIRALSGKEKALGPDHASTLDTVDNLGSLFSEQGHLEDAERMYIRALSGKEKALGPDHISTLNTVNNFGNLLLNQGRLEDAEPMYIRALSGKENALGPDHMFTLNTVNNLALLYWNQGRLEDAEPMYIRALSGYEKALGPDHATTLDTIDNLGLLYSDQGRLEDAERMYSRALSGKEKALGPDHASTLDTVDNLGSLFSEQGHLEDAERMYIRALSGKEKALGPDHTSTLDTVNNLGLLYSDQGRLEDAERLYSRALSGYEKTLGPDHMSTLRTVNNLENLYSKQGRLEDVEMLRDHMKLRL